LGLTNTTSALHGSSCQAATSGARSANGAMPISGSATASMPSPRSCATQAAACAGGRVTMTRIQLAR
jgi:hypothetical protein